VIAQARLFWDGRSERERWLLGVMFALIAAVLLIFAIILPIIDGLAAARERLDRATIASGQVEARIAALDRAKRAPVLPLGTPLATIVNTTAGEAGFAPERASAQGEDRVAITIPAAKSTALFGWLATLDARGVFAETITVRRNADASLAAEAVLKRRDR
jgi:general secretion pathway protein M